jgi:hypothetical protein
MNTKEPNDQEELIFNHLEKLHETFRDSNDIPFDEDEVKNRFNEIKNIMITSQYRSKSIWESIVNELSYIYQKIDLYHFLTKTFQPSDNIVPKIEWIDKWFSMKFADVAQEHIIDDEYRILADKINRVILTICINNRSAVVYGSFSTFLLNKSIHYNDIDISYNNDIGIMTVCILLYILYSNKTFILSIPYIVNHRSIRAVGDEKNNGLADIVWYHEKMVIPKYTFVIPMKGSKIYISISSFITQFFNYTKMFHLPDRRSKIEAHKPNQKHIISTIWSQLLNILEIESDKVFDSITPYKRQIDTCIDKMIRIKLLLKDKLEYDIIFHTTCRDDEYYDRLLDVFKYMYTPRVVNLSQSRVIKITQQGGMFPEQRVVVLIRNNDGSSRIITHINVSRNDVYYNTEPISKLVSHINSNNLNNPSMRFENYLSTQSSMRTLPSITVMNLMSIIGLHIYLSDPSVMDIGSTKESYIHTNGVINSQQVISPITSDYVRVIRTIKRDIMLYEPSNFEVKYPRTKNKGFHVAKYPINDSNISLPRLSYSYYMEHMSLQSFLDKDTKYDIGSIVEYQTLLEEYR